MTNEQLMSKIGPFVTDDIIRKTRPTKVHVGPRDDVDATVALAQERSLTETITPDDQGTYGIGDLIAILAAHVKTTGEAIARDKEEMFRQDVRGPNEWVLRCPRGKILTLHNTGMQPCALILSETSSGDPIVNVNIPPQTIIGCSIPFIRGIWCKQASNLPVFVAGQYIQGGEDK